MSKRLSFLLSLCIAVIDVNIGHASHVRPRRGVFDSPPPLETGRVGKPEDYQHTLYERSRQRRFLEPGDQFVFNSCPERFHNPIKQCDECGGDSKRHGICNDLLVTGSAFANQDCRRYGFPCSGYYCKCTHEGQDHNPQITSTAVVDGQTGIVVFEPLTLTEYEKLRHKTSVTVTELATATASDADSTLETAIAVVFAGGISWIAISQSGGVAAIAAIKPPAEAPEDAKKDDPSCMTDPEEECSKCGGSDDVGLCTTGDQAGCPCQETQNCPNEPPRCSDEQCGGDNGLSQCAASGEIQGCLCCPDEASCTDEQCKGNPLQQCTSEKWNECGCIVDADQGAIDITENIPGIKDRAERSSSLSSIANYVFTTVWGGKYENVPGYTKPTKKPSNPCETQTVEVPGKCGVPACQYVIAADKGINALCEDDYCFCDGVAVALLTTVVDGSTSTGCGYQTLPTEDACGSKTEAPPAPTEPPKVNKPGSRESCLRNSDCEKFVCDDGGRKAVCNYDVDPGSAFCRC